MTPALAILPHPSLPWESQPPVVAVTACLWGEARSEDLETIAAVACVVRNRRAKRGCTWVAIVTQPKQFSCFNPADPNAAKLRNPGLEGDAGLRAWRRCQVIAQAVMDELLPDNTGGATHYETCPDSREPSWADKLELTTRMGSFEFYKEKKT